MKYQVALISDKGGRNINEDYAAYLQHKGHGCYVVADGLGGHYGGDLAAKTACVSVIEAFKKQPGSTADYLTMYLKTAGQAMEALQSKVGRGNSAKTTLVILLTGDGCATWAHVGDSRLYRFKAGRIVFQTRDHSLPQYLVNSGEITADQVRFHEDRNLLLKVFDSNDTSCFVLYSKAVIVEPKDAFLICSDGFWDYIYEEEMESDLNSSVSARDWVSKMEKRLLSRAEEKYDNYTALAVIAEKKNFFRPLLSR